MDFGFRRNDKNWRFSTFYEFIKFCIKAGKEAMMTVKNPQISH